MNLTSQKHLFLFWYKKYVRGFSCKNFYRNRTMASDSQNDQAGSKNDKLKKSHGEETTRVSKSQLLSFLQFVKFDQLSATEQLIHATHLEALDNGCDTYKDPVTGYSVFTRLAHLRRGICCGSACRHCPYGHKEVPADKKKKTYNSAFYV